MLIYLWASSDPFMTLDPTRTYLWPIYATTCDPFETHFVTKGSQMDQVGPLGVRTNYQL